MRMSRTSHFRFNPTYNFCCCCCCSSYCWFPLIFPSSFCNKFLIRILFAMLLFILGSSECLLQHIFQFYDNFDTCAWYITYDWFQIYHSHVPILSVYLNIFIARSQYSFIFCRRQIFHFSHFKMTFLIGIWMGKHYFERKERKEKINQIQNRSFWMSGYIIFARNDEFYWKVGFVGN